MVHAPAPLQCPITTLFVLCTWETQPPVTMLLSVCAFADAASCNATPSTTKLGSCSTGSNSLGGTLTPQLKYGQGVSGEVTPEDALPRKL